MNHRHRKVLHALFADPIPNNLSMKEVEGVLGELGAILENRHGSRIAVTLQDKTVVVHHAGHALPKDEVVQIRRFLESCAIDPARDYPL